MSVESIIRARVQEHKQKKVDMWNKSIPEALKGYDLDSLIDSKWNGHLTVSYIKKFTTYLSKPSKFLVLYGASGLGKTVMGVEVCHRLLKNGTVESAQYIDAPTLMSECSFSSDGANKVVQKYSRPDILLLDDLGASTVEMTSIRKTVLWSIINNRWSQGKYTIITTNLPQTNASANSLDVSLRDYVGESAWDRIVDSCTTLVFSGKSFRMNKTRR